MPVAIATRRHVAAVLVLVMAGCSAPAVVDLPTRPPVPEDWQQFTSADREVAITVPPQLVVEDDRSGILAGFHDPAIEISSLGVLAIGPTAMTQQPTPPLTETRLADWLLEAISNRRPETYTQSSVVLPAGEAVEVRFTFDAGTPDEVAVVGYAIPTARGVAFLTANCQARPMARCSEFLRLVPQLVELNTPTAS